jgi:hypothetical protein
MRSHQTLAILCTALLAAAGTARADDPKTGAVIRVPADKRTIQAALAAARSGDTILVAPGRYSGPIRLIGKAVTLASHFHNSADRRDIERTVLGTRQRGGAVVHVSATASGSKIVGFTITGGREGVLALGKTHVLHCRLLRCGDAVHFVDSGGSVRNCHFEAARDDAVDVDGATDVTIEANTIRNSGDDGVELRLHRYAGTEALNVVIRGNTIAGCREDGIQIIDHAGPSNRVVRIERNLIRDTRMAAVGCMDGGQSNENYKGAPIPDRIYLINNTLLNNHYGLTGGANLIALNNLFVGCRNAAAKNVAGKSVLAHNLFWKNGTDALNSNVIDASTLRKDPRLDADGRPQRDSPCIDAGVAEFTWKDEKVLALPAKTYAGKAPDLGAFETGMKPDRK